MTRFRSALAFGLFVLTGAAAGCATGSAEPAASHAGHSHESPPAGGSSAATQTATLAATAPAADPHAGHTHAPAPAEPAPAQSSVPATPQPASPPPPAAPATSAPATSKGHVHVQSPSPRRRRPGGRKAMALSSVSVIGNALRLRRVGAIAGRRVKL